MGRPFQVEKRGDNPGRRPLPERSRRCRSPFIQKAMLAAFFFKAAFEIDPLAISPHEQIQALPDLPVLAALKDWSLRSFTL